MRSRIAYIFVLGLISALFQNCAPSDSSAPSSKPSAGALPPPPSDSEMVPTPIETPVAEKFCYEDLNCKRSCDAVFRFTSAQEIERQEPPGGATLVKIAKNELAIQNHLKCLSLPVSQVSQFIVSPMTLEDISPIRVSTNGYLCFDNDQVVSCN